MRKALGSMLTVLLLFGAPAAPAGAQEPLTADEVMAFVEVALLFDGDVDFAERNMVDNSLLQSGLAKLIRVGHGVIDAPPSVALPAFREAAGLELLSEGDPGFENSVPMTHFWAAEFDRAMDDLAGVAEIGVNLYDAGAPPLAVPELPYAPTTGSSRQIAAFFGAAKQGPFGNSAYAITGEDGRPDLFSNPFLVAVGLLPNGNWLLVFAGPFSPEWSFYVSGREGDPNAPDFFDGLAGYRTERRPAAVEPISQEMVDQAVADDPSLVEQIRFLVTGESSAATPPPVATDSVVDGNPATDGSPATDTNTATDGTPGNPAPDAQGEGAAPTPAGPPIVELPDDEGGGGGFPWVVVVVPVVVAGVVVTWLVQRRRPGAAERGWRTVYDPAEMPADQTEVIETLREAFRDATRTSDGYVLVRSKDVPVVLQPGEERITPASGWGIHMDVSEEEAAGREVIFDEKTGRIYSRPAQEPISIDEGVALS